MDTQLAALGLPPRCTFAEVQAQYRKLMKCWHPDRFPAGDPMRTYAEQRSTEINLAFQYVRKNRRVLFPSVDWSAAENEVTVQTGLHRKRALTSCFMVVRRKRRTRKGGGAAVRLAAPNVVRNWYSARRRAVKNWWEEFRYYCA